MSISAKAIASPTALPGLYVGGAWIEPQTTATITVVNPATGAEVGTAPDGSVADVDVAVEAASAAYVTWSATLASQRGAILDRLGREIGIRAELLGRAVSTENGSPLSETTATARAAASILQYYGSLASALDEPDLRANDQAGLSTTVARRGVGVAGLITPWNFPLTLLAMKLGPALAAGCTVVVKPAPETPLHTSWVVEAIEAAGVPAGVINIVTGGPQAGDALVRHPGVKKIAFTGSTAVGKHIAELCARQLKPVTLELGGKSAALVLDDVDPEVFAATMLRTCMRNTGQTCYAATRLLFPKSRYDELVGIAASMLQRAVVGDPLAAQTEIGPVVTDRQRARIEEYIRVGVEEGAVIVTGGGRPDRPTGFYVEPTLFRDVTADMTIAREEIFGPVLVALAYDTEEDGIALANASDYGLGGVVYSSSPDRARRVANRFESGAVGINSFALNPLAPFGGWKDSGLGVEMGPEAIDAYVRYQSVTEAR